MIVKANKDGGTTVGFSKGILEKIKESSIPEYKSDFKISDIPEFKAEYILVEALEQIIKTGKDWDWGDDFWAVKRASEALIKYKSLTMNKEYEPYMGWCDVEGCENEAAYNGGCWRESGYWLICSKHSQEHREGKPQPKMKQTAIDRENSRDSNGYLPPTPTKIDFHIEENLEQINKQQWEDIFSEFQKVEHVYFNNDLGVAAGFRHWLQKNYNAPEKK